MHELRVIQVNCNRSRPVHTLVDAIANKRCASLTLISEPNKTLARSRRDWIVDERVNVSIASDGSPCITKQGAGAGFAWVDVAEVGRVYSCYISPNCSIEEFETFLDNLTSSTNDAPNSNAVLLSGDFNATCETWGAPRSDKRGRLMLDWMAANNLVVMNDGLHPTFHRAEQESYIDLTVCSVGLADKVKDWKVLTDEENLSDRIRGHQTTSTADKLSRAPL